MDVDEMKKMLKTLLRKKRLFTNSRSNRISILLPGLILLLPLNLFSQTLHNSGGPIIHEQASYDINFYDLTLFVNPDDSTIQGKLLAKATVLNDLEWFVLDLDPALLVNRVSIPGGNGVNPLFFKRKEGQLWIKLPQKSRKGQKLEIAVAYGGRPLIAPNNRNSWADGFVWTKSKTGEPWIGIVSVLNGADIWWPCKDSPSDEADSMALHITVPEPLTVASNGKLRKYERLGGRPRMHRFHWFISTPVNNYGVTLNIAQYSKIEDAYRSINGERVPIIFWVMPEDYGKAMRLFPQFKKQLRFLERTLGPYPFRADKYGVAQTPYLGMEHQTVISYGGDFTNNPYGFDTLHFHELTHEWFANMVTAADWKDWWLHEGIGTYLEALYAESLHDENVYHDYMSTLRLSIQNSQALAPLKSQRSRDIYSVDLYRKGAWVLHSLRYLIGRDNLVKSLRKLAYPKPELEYVANGKQCRFVTSHDFIEIVEEVSGKNLEWFFEIYLRQPELPTLVSEQFGNELRLSWVVPGNQDFPMPVEIKIGSETKKFELSSKVTVVEIPDGLTPIVDPSKWILKAKSKLTTSKFN